MRLRATAMEIMAVLDMICSLLKLSHLPLPHYHRLRFLASISPSIEH
jgi:hypothetical protein